MVSDWVHALVLAALVLATLGGLAMTVGGEPTDPGPAGAIDAPPAQTDDFETLAPRGRWNPSTGTGEIILDNESYYTVFQGEADVDAWRDTSGADVTGTVLDGEAGQSEGAVLDLSSSVPASQAPGRYSGDDPALRVQEPQIRTVTLYNSGGTELDDISELRHNERLLVVADWNYVEAEDLQVDMIDRDGDITIEREILATSPTGDQSDRLPAGFDDETLAQEVQGVGTTGYRTAYWLFDFDELDDGAYTLRIEGVDDPTDGEAVKTIRFNVGTARTATPTATPTATQSPTATVSPTQTATPPTTASDGTSTPPPATATPSPESTPTTATPTQTTGADGPGFGPLLTLAALAVALSVARYHHRH